MMMMMMMMIVCIMLSIALKFVSCEYEIVGMHAYQPMTLSTDMQVSIGTGCL